jgi:alkanesulfonate monooxygenase SsuD/methylene tetrahydromethanopterin reductase-like flavin-dependent oxidoreductase (luciferase family)
MLRATEHIRVGIGAVPCDRRPASDVARELATAELPLDRLVLVVGSGASSSVAAVRAAVAELRAELGPSISLGVAAMGERMCRLGGEISDLVLLNWMNPDRIRWARRQIRKGAGQRLDGLRHPEPEVASYIRVSIGQGAALRVGDEAARYATMPQYARNFTAMGTASVGIAAADPAQAAGLLEPYLAVLDETIVRPIVKLPPSRSPEFEEVFETLSVLVEVASLLAPPPASAQPVSPDAETPAPASPPEV